MYRARYLGFSHIGPRGVFLVAFMVYKQQDGHDVVDWRGFGDKIGPEVFLQVLRDFEGRDFVTGRQIVFGSSASRCIDLGYNVRGESRGFALGPFTFCYGYQFLLIDLCH